MGIRARVILATIVVAAVLLLAFSVLTYIAATTGMNRLEQVDVRDSLGRASAAIDEKTSDLGAVARDWSVWDPLWEFARDPASVPGFVAENVVSPQSMAKVGVDVFIIADANGKIVYSEGVDPATLESTHAPAAALDYAARRAASPAGRVADDKVAGLMNTANGPMMIVAQPILRSDGSGPVAGTILFGRYFTSTEIAEIEKITQMNVTVSPAGALATPLGAPVIRDVSATTVTGSETLSGIGGQAAVLEVTLPRNAFAIARDSTVSTGLWIGLIVAVMSGSLFLTLDYAVIRRLSKLGDDVSNVTGASDLSLRVSPMGNDEIGTLSEEINQMLDTVEGSSDSLKESNLKLERMVYDVAESMGRVVEARDPYTQGHQERVARLAGEIAREMGMSGDEVSFVEFAGTVHDIGKLGVPAEILSKPGRLSETEHLLIREHSLRGHEILSGIEFPWPVADVVLQHHERMDGSGYPSGLADGEILPEARILAVADVVEAMASHRPYRPALGVDAAVEYLREEPEKFDPEVVAACIRLWETGRVGL